MVYSLARHECTYARHCKENAQIYMSYIAPETPTMSSVIADCLDLAPPNILGKSTPMKRGLPWITGWPRQRDLTRSTWSEIKSMPGLLMGLVFPTNTNDECLCLWFRWGRTWRKVKISEKLSKITFSSGNCVRNCAVALDYCGKNGCDWKLYLSLLR